MRRPEARPTATAARPAAAPGAAARRTGTLLPLSLLVACLGAQNAVAATLLPAVFAGFDATARFSANYAFFFGANLVGVVVGGVLGQRHPPGRVLVGGIVVLVAGAGLVAAAGGAAPVLAGRAAQGLGGGVAIVVVYVAIGAGFPAARRPAALAAVATGWVVATIVAPVVAAAVAEATTWRAAYGALGVLVAAAGGLTCRRLWSVRPPASRESGRALGLVLVPAAAVVGIGLELGTGATSVVLLAILVAVLAVGLRPLLPPGTYRLRVGVAAAIGLRGILMGAFAATELWLPFVLTEVRGVGTVASGAWLSVGAAGWAAGSFTFARGVRAGLTGAGRVRAARAGSAVLAVGAIGQGLVLVPDVPLVVPLSLWVVAAYGMGLALVPMGTSLYEESPIERYPMNAAALQLADVSIAAVIIGVGSTLSAVVAPEHRLEVVASSFLLAALCATAAAVAATRISSPAAE